MNEISANDRLTEAEARVRVEREDADRAPRDEVYTPEGVQAALAAAWDEGWRAATEYPGQHRNTNPYREAGGGQEDR